MRDSARPLHLIFVRHAEAEGAAGRCIGQTDLALSEPGRASLTTLCAELAASGQELARVLAADPGEVILLSSDLRRASETAQSIADTFALRVVHDRRLREMSFGLWDGATWEHLEASDGVRLSAWMQHWQTAAPPEGETVEDVVRRVDEVLDELRLIPQQAALIVAHAGWIRLALCRIRGIASDQMFDLDVPYATPLHCSLSRTAERSAPVQ